MLNGFKVKSFTPFPLENPYFLRAKKNISNKKKLQPTSRLKKKIWIQPTFPISFCFLLTTKKLTKNNQKKKQQLNSKNPQHFPSLNSCNSPSARWHRLWYSGASDAGPPPRGKASDVSSCSSSAAAESWRKAKEASSKRSCHQRTTEGNRMTGWLKPRRGLGP